MTAYCSLAAAHVAVKNTFVCSPGPTDKRVQNPRAVRASSLLHSSLAKGSLSEPHKENWDQLHPPFSIHFSLFRSASSGFPASSARKLLKPAQQCRRNSNVLAQCLEPLSCLCHPIPSGQTQPGGGRNAAPVHRQEWVQRGPPGHLTLLVAFDLI